MRALVTGASGFVGPYLVERLQADGYDVIAAGGPNEDGREALPLDLSDADNLNATFDIAQPDVVFHLAAQAFVPESLRAPMQTYETNILGTARLLEALRGRRDRSGAACRLLFVSSAEVYGRQADPARPIEEGAPLHPANPYAASKAAAEAIVLGEAQSFGVDAVIARAFNHIGPGQSDRFAVASFAAQLAKISRGDSAVMRVGNLQARRDFLDVRDVVSAYAALAEHGQSGEIYNVCSGVATGIKDVLAELIRISHVAVEVREDAGRMRPADVALSYGHNQKLRSATGWSQRISLRASLQDIYAAAQISAAP